MDCKGKKINFLGDSITEGVGTSAPEFRYVNRLKKQLGLAEARNYGLSGTRIARQQHPNFDDSFDRDFCLRIDEMDPDADAVVVFGGTNDFGHGDAPRGAFCDREPGTFYGACHYLCRHLMEKYPGKPIIIITPLHRAFEDNPHGDCNKTYYFGALIDYINIIREVAAYYSLPVLDLYATSGLQPDVPVIRERFMPDSLHPSDDGNAILADRIAGFLQAL